MANHTVHLPGPSNMVFFFPEMYLIGEVYCPIDCNVVISQIKPSKVRVALIFIISCGYIFIRAPKKD